jgi:hypothetical protein
MEPLAADAMSHAGRLEPLSSYMLNFSRPWRYWVATVAVAVCCGALLLVVWMWSTGARGGGITLAGRSGGQGWAVSLHVGLGGAHLRFERGAPRPVGVSFSRTSLFRVPARLGGQRFSFWGFELTGLQRSVNDFDVMYVPFVHLTIPYWLIALGCIAAIAGWVHAVRQQHRCIRGFAVESRGKEASGKSERL